MATSVIVAFEEKVDALSLANLTAALRPPIYLDSVPAVDGNAQVRPPWAVLKVTSPFVPKLDTSAGGIEAGEFGLDIYAESLGDIDTIVTALKYNNAAPNLKGGLDFGALTLTGRYIHISTRPTGNRAAHSGINYNGARVHMRALTYRVVVQLVAT